MSDPTIPPCPPLPTAGERRESATSAAGVGPAPKRRTFPLWAKIGIPVAAVAITATLVIISFAMLPDAKGRAIAACQEEVLDQLKAPRSAEFFEFEAFDENDVRAEVAEDGDEPSEDPNPDELLVMVTGEVDSQNSFGATVSSSVLCTVTTEDGEMEVEASVF